MFPPDVLLIGPFDLGNNLGYPILKPEMDQELKDAIARILKATHAAGKKCAVYAVNGDQARTYADQGFDMVSTSPDPSISQRTLGLKKSTDLRPQRHDCPTHRDGRRSRKGEGVLGPRRIPGRQRCGIRRSEPCLAVE